MKHTSAFGSPNDAGARASGRAGARVRRPVVRAGKPLGERGRGEAAYECKRGSEGGAFSSVRTSSARMRCGCGAMEAPAWCKATARPQVRIADIPGMDTVLHEANLDFNADGSRKLTLVSDLTMGLHYVHL